MKFRNIRTLLLPFLLVGFIGGLTGCNTLEGAGEDIETAGEELDEEIDTEG